MFKYLFIGMLFFSVNVFAEGAGKCNTDECPKLVAQSEAGHNGCEETSDAGILSPSNPDQVANSGNGGSTTGEKQTN